MVRNQGETNEEILMFTDACGERKCCGFSTIVRNNHDGSINIRKGLRGKTRREKKIMKK
jgi:hypothetical protein